MRALGSLLFVTLLACTDPVVDASVGGMGGAPSIGATITSTAGGGGMPGPMVPDPNCTEAGCIHAVDALGSFNKQVLTPLLEPGVEIDNGYSLFVITYVTTPPDAGPITSRATVAIPYPAEPPPGGYAVVANAHGTVGLDDPCALSGTAYGSGLAGLFGARGAISVATDYPGLGTPGLHPYLVSAVEGAAVLDSLRAAVALATSLDVPTSGRHGVVGLSQGGHATLAAAALHASYAPDLDVRAFAAAAPASAWLEQWAEGVALEGEHITFHAMLMYAWADFYHHEGGALWHPDVESIIDDVMHQRCTFDFGGAQDVIGDALSTSATAVFDAGFLDAYQTQTLTPSYPAIAAAFSANRIGAYPQTAQLAIWQGDADTTVPAVYTDALVAALRAGGVTVDYRIVPGAEHLTTAFGFVAQAQARTAESTAWVLDRVYSNQ